MKRTAIAVVAFCTIGTLLFPVPGAAETLASNQRALSLYRAEQLARGAQDFPVLAQIYYQQAIRCIENSNNQEAETLLVQAMKLDPSFPDACFTLARLKALNLDPDAFLFLMRAFQAIARNFHSQSLLAANAILFAILLLIIVAIIIGIALVAKYLPFSAHRLKEILHSRFNATHSTLAAYLILLIPFALFPGFITGFAIMLVITWIYLSRREKALVFFITSLLILTGFFAETLKRFTPITDPRSLNAAISEANTSAGDPALIRLLEKRPAGHPALKMNKNLSLGLLSLRADDLYSASDYFLKTIESDPGNALAYINLSNVYYLQGEYEKSLEGYIKAEAIDSLNAIGQYNLAQAYIKTLLMAKSSEALNKAAAAGIEDVKAAYAGDALRNIQVFPAPFPNRALWRMALIEGALSDENFILDLFIPLAHFPPRLSAWILLLALVSALAAGRAVRATWLTFPCANCGKLTCSGCCNNDRGMIMCNECGKTIEGISSDKVIDALLRQRRQVRLVTKRKAERFLICWLPGMKSVYHGNLFGGVVLAMLFGASVIGLWSRGLLIEDWQTLAYQSNQWHMYVPAATLLLSYAISIFKNQKQKSARPQQQSAKKGSKQGTLRREDGRRKQAAL